MMLVFPVSYILKKQTIVDAQRKDGKEKIPTTVPCPQLIFPVSAFNIKIVYSIHLRRMILRK